MKFANKSLPNVQVPGQLLGQHLKPSLQGSVPGKGLLGHSDDDAVHCPTATGG